MWCGPCNVAATDVTGTVQRFAEHDLRYITVLIENSIANEPSQQDLENWANSYGITEPVLGGSRDLLSSSPQAGWPLSSWPTFILITEDMEIYLFQAGYSQALLDYLIENTIDQTQ